MIDSGGAEVVEHAWEGHGGANGGAAMTAELAGRYTGLTRLVALERHSIYRKSDRIVAAMPAGRVLEERACA